MTIKSLEKPSLSFTGKVVGGKGKAVFFTQLDWVQAQCLTEIGFLPYPGTLNLQITCDDLWSRIESSDVGKMVELVPTNPSFCTGKALHAIICGIQVAIILPEEEVRPHGKKNRGNYGANLPS